MIDISLFDPSPAMAKKIALLDANHNGVISGSEVKAASPETILKIKAAATTNGDHDLLSQIYSMGNGYPLEDGTYKGMAPGDGGRFQAIVDRLVAAGHSHDSATKIAVAIAKRKAAIAVGA